MPHLKGSAHMSRSSSDASTQHKRKRDSEADGGQAADDAGQAADDALFTDFELRNELKVLFMPNPHDNSKWLVSFDKNHSQSTANRILQAVQCFRIPVQYGFQFIVEAAQVGNVVGVLKNVDYGHVNMQSMNNFNKGAAFEMIRSHVDYVRVDRAYVSFFFCLHDKNLCVVTFDGKFDDDDVKAIFVVDLAVATVQKDTHAIVVGRQYTFTSAKVTRLVGQLFNAGFKFVESLDFIDIEAFIREGRNFRLYLEIPSLTPPFSDDSSEDGDSSDGGSVDSADGGSVDSANDGSVGSAGSAGSAVSEDSSGSFVVVSRWPSPVA